MKISVESKIFNRNRLESVISPEFFKTQERAERKVRNMIDEGDQRMLSLERSEGSVTIELVSNSYHEPFRVQVVEIKNTEVIQ